MVVKDCPAFFYLFWGAIKAGIVPVPLNTMLRAADYAYLFEDSGCGLVVYSSEYAKEVEPAIKVKACTADAFLAKMARASDTLEARLASPTDDCFWLYSSGSTGRPKGAVHLQRDMVVTSELYGVRVLGMREERCQLLRRQAVLRLWPRQLHDLPAVDGQHRGARRPPADARHDLRDHRDLQAHALLRCADALCRAARRRSSRSPATSQHPRLRLGRRGAAGRHLPALEGQDRHGHPGRHRLDRDACTSSSATASTTYRPGTSGRPVPGYEIEIVDEHGKPVRPGDSGRLWIRGNSAAKYYWNKPEKTAETMVDGWLDTGDTYRQDEDGYYIYDGRSDDMLKVGGIWCSPVEIESCLIGASRRARGRRRRPRRRERPDQAEGLRRAEAGGRRRPGADRRADGALQDARSRPTNTRAGSNT